MKKDDKRTLIVVLVVCVICGLVIFLVSRKSNMDKMAIVKDYSTFFSIAREVEDYIGYIASDEYDKINDLIDSGFNNNIEFPHYSSLTSLSIYSIYYVNIKGDYLYLVQGKIIENDFDSSNVIDANFIILVLNDTSTNSFSVYPVNKNNYKKIINGIRKININNNSVNKMVSTEEFNDVQICKLYFSDYISKLYNNINDAYLMLSDSMKKTFANEEEFKKYINDNISNISTSSKLCKMDEYKDSRAYNVIDNNDNSYIFTENGVMNYKVSFYFKINEE